MATTEEIIGRETFRVTAESVAPTMSKEEVREKRRRRKSQSSTTQDPKLVLSKATVKGGVGSDIVITKTVGGEVVSQERQRGKRGTKQIQQRAQASQEQQAIKKQEEQTQKQVISTKKKEMFPDTISAGEEKSLLVRKREEFTSSFREGFSLSPKAEQRVRGGTGLEAAGFTLGSTAAFFTPQAGKVIGGTLRNVPLVPKVAASIEKLFSLKPVQITLGTAIAGDIAFTGATEGRIAAVRETGLIGRDVAFLGSTFKTAAKPLTPTEAKLQAAALTSPILGVQGGRGKPKRLSKAELRQRGAGLQTKQEQQFFRQEQQKQQLRIPQPPKIPKTQPKTKTEIFLKSKPATTGVELFPKLGKKIKSQTEKEITLKTKTTVLRELPRTKSLGEKKLEKLRRQTARKLKKADFIAVSQKETLNKFIKPTGERLTTDSIKQPKLPQSKETGQQAVQLLKTKPTSKQKPTKEQTNVIKTPKLQDKSLTQREAVELQKKLKQLEPTETFIPEFQGQRGVLPPREQAARLRLSKLIEGRAKELESLKIPKQSSIPQAKGGLEFTPSAKIKDQPLSFVFLPSEKLKPTIEQPKEIISLDEKQDIKPAQIMDIRQDEAFIPIQDTKPAQIQDIRQDEAFVPVQEPIEILTPKTGRKRPSQPTPTKPLLPPNVKPSKVSEPIFSISPRIPKPPKEFVRPIQSPLGFKVPLNSGMKQPLFNVEVGSPSNKFFFESRGLTIDQAIEFGRSKVKSTAAASFKIEPTRSGTDRNFLKRIQSSLGGEFRKSKKNDNIFVQKRKFRISSIGEKEDITLLGLQTLSKKDLKSLF